MLFINSIRFVIILVNFQRALGHNILFLISSPIPSHWFFMENFIDALLKKGHYVTAITSYKSINKSSNYTEVLINPSFPMDKISSSEKLFSTASPRVFKHILYLYRAGLIISKYGLENEEVQKFIKRKGMHFDLIVANQYNQESWLMFGHKFKSPIITLSTYGHSDVFDRFFGFQTPWSYVPHTLLTYNDQMTFVQRFYNTIVSIYDLILRHWYYLPAQNEIALNQFKNLEKNIESLPSVQELEKSISLVLVNDHQSLSTPRPKPSTIIEIGGAHIKPPRTLPTDIQNYLDSASSGAIYFSLGAYMKSAKMPKEKVEMFLDTFKQLKQKILWKWEDENMANLPKNVLIRKWMPQSDILAHKNVILFITHGGMFGTMEGIHYGLPMLFLPLFGDQHRNALKATNSGYGLMLHFNDINANDLNGQLKELISNQSYYKKAKEISKLFNDNPIQPLDNAVFWMEYVIRHKGVKHLKSIAAINQSYFNYMLLDVYAVIIGGLLLIVMIIRKLFKKSRQKKCTKSSNNKLKIN